MIEHQVSKYNFNDFTELLYKDVEEHKTLIVTMKPAKIGIWGLARLWRAWMSTTAKYMASNGVTMPLMIGKDGKYFGKRPFNSQDAHELFTSNHMGTDADGTRLSWAKNSHDGMRAANKGERVDALRKHEIWCIERGINIFKPRDSEYNELMEKQNK